MRCNQERDGGDGNTVVMMAEGGKEQRTRGLMGVLYEHTIMAQTIRNQDIFMV